MTTTTTRTKQQLENDFAIKAERLRQLDSYCTHSKDAKAAWDGTASREQINKLAECHEESDKLQQQLAAIRHELS